MGEANYYGGIHFPTADEAHAAQAPIAKFLRQGTAAYDDWQSHRDSRQGDKRMSAKKRFHGIAKRNREVFEALGLENRYEEYLAQFRQEGEEDAEDGCLNCLSGQMSFPENPTILIEGATVIFSGSTWHMATWTRLIEGMRKQFGGINAAWVSDEQVAGDADRAKAALLGKLEEKSCKASDSILSLVA